MVYSKQEHMDDDEEKTFKEEKEEALVGRL